MDWTVANVIRLQARAHSAHAAISYEGRTITYGELEERSSRVAQGLVAEGVAPQDRVAFLDKNGPEYFEILFGAAKANAVMVAVNWRLAPPEIEYTINDAEAKVLFVGSEFLPYLEAVEASLRTVEKIVVLGEHSRHEGYEGWVLRHPSHDPERAAAPDDVALQLYTSGTTGRPKGAMLTNTGLGTCLTNSTLAYGIDDTAITVTLLPLFHMAGVGLALSGMWIGAHTVLFRDFAPGDVLAAITEQGVTDALLVPAMLQALCSWPGADRCRSSSLRSIVYGASPITDEVLARSAATFGCRFTQIYGMTESGTISMLGPEDHDRPGPRARILRSAGRPCPWVEVRVVDPHTGETRAVGEAGEVWVRSAQTMQGYWNQPGETAATITAEGWLKTGDAGF
ncbi:MAG: AMP-binding protein, partial [Acidimicrobiia bacterium]